MRARHGTNKLIKRLGQQKKVTRGCPGGRMGVEQFDRRIITKRKGQIKKTKKSIGHQKNNDTVWQISHALHILR